MSLKHGIHYFFSKPPLWNLNTTAQWHPEPTIRGTYTLLSSCILTLAICVWSVIHVEIPAPRRKKAQWGLKVLLVLLGMIAPEAIAFLAFSERRQVSGLTAEMTEKLKRPSLRSKWSIKFENCRLTAKIFWNWMLRRDSRWILVPRRVPNYNKKWTHTHSHYLLMGGFAFSDESFLPLGTTRGTFTPDGLKYFVDNGGNVPEISKDEIKDKSKSDNLGKFIAFAQLLWFCLQCFTRKIEGLPLSLLELTTFAHILFAVFAYVFWWYKPFDVAEPTLVDLSDPRLQALVAYMWMNSASATALNGNGEQINEFESVSFMDEIVLDSSENSSQGDSAQVEESQPASEGVRFGEAGNSNVDVEMIDLPQIDSSKRHPNSVTPTSIIIDIESRTSEIPVESTGYINSDMIEENQPIPPRTLSDLEFQTHNLHQAADAGGFVKLEAGQRLQGASFALNGASSRFLKTTTYKAANKRGTIRGPTTFKETTRYAQTVRLAPPDVLRWQLASRAIYQDKLPKPTEKGYEWLILEAKTARKPHWGWSSKKTGFFFAIGAVFYGGIHASAWNYPFRTGSDQWIWRWSVVGMVCPLLSIMSGQFYVAYFGHGKMRKVHSNRVLLFPFAMVAFVVTVACAIPAGLYLGFKFYFIVESFINVFYLPEAFWKAARMGRWTCHIFHIGTC